MNCFIDVRQFKKPECHETLTHLVFLTNLNLNYEVDYLPHHLHFNLKSRKLLPLQLHSVQLLDDSQVRHTVSAFLSRSLIPDSQFDSIAKTIYSKAKSIACDPINSGFNFIPITICIRAIWIQQYDHQVKLAWESLLPDGGRISANMPAMETSVEQLETVVYDGIDAAEEEEEQCPICLKDFEVGEEIKRLPCLHLYHGPCIVKWLRNSYICPTCRFPMPVCRVVEGTFPFFRRKPIEPQLPAVAGRIRIGARMSTRQYAIH